MKLPLQCDTPSVGDNEIRLPFRKIVTQCHSLSVSHVMRCDDTALQKVYNDSHPVDHDQ
jgi:hypothetical protein